MGWFRSLFGKNDGEERPAGAPSSPSTDAEWRENAPFPGYSVAAYGLPSPRGGEPATEVLLTQTFADILYDMTKADPAFVSFGVTDIYETGWVARDDKGEVLDEESGHAFVFCEKTADDADDDDGQIVVRTTAGGDFMVLVSKALAPHFPLLKSIAARLIAMEPISVGENRHWPKGS